MPDMFCPFLCIINIKRYRYGPLRIANLGLGQLQVCISYNDLPGLCNSNFQQVIDQYGCGSASAKNKDGLHIKSRVELRREINIKKAIKPGKTTYKNCLKAVRKLNPQGWKNRPKKHMYLSGFQP